MDDFMDRVDQLAKETSAWWTEEKVRSRRITLLKPYNLRFNKDEDKSIQLIFFNGRYAERYGEWMRTVAHTESDGEAQTWARVVTCSRCKPRRDRDAQKTDDAALTGANPAQLTGATREK
jgi:hypothetical protein